MKTSQILAMLLTSLALISACDEDARMAQEGFRLPEGDAAAGREAFVYMQCHQCHTIEGMELPTIPGEDPPYVELGGKVTKVKTYGALITAIIYPSRKLASGYDKEVVSHDGESNMYVYNRHMTVQELIDITMFLQAEYDVVVPEAIYRGHR